ncbi:MAG: hypothetical protein CMB73_03380 [Euryarchaeota archaeon]|nr:hypothetical protein [Euryarchaeota archaeon]|tara:strand:+ start:734 stop:1516 length:783 start_codon:yes stop_codon:yes gene_type:complete
MKLFSQHVKSRHKRWWVDKDPHIHKNLAGKLTGRKFVENLGLKVPILYHLGDSIEEIPHFDELPSKFVLKPSRGWSAKNIFVMVDGVNQLDGKSWSRQEIVDSIVSQPEVHNHKSTKIIIEEYLEDWKKPDLIPYDYKFYMFGSECAFVTIIERNSNVNSNKNRFWNITMDWKSCEFKIIKTQTPEEVLPDIPDCWDELCETAIKLGKELGIFMRIDLYATKRGAVFGEFTPQPHGGNGFTEEADKWLGSIWRGLEGAGE